MPRFLGLRGNSLHVAGGSGVNVDQRVDEVFLRVRLINRCQLGESLAFKASVSYGLNILLEFGGN
jgi:hypothetical protein